MNIKTIKSDNTYHHKTISKIHLEWARNGVYERAYNQTLEFDIDMFTLSSSNT